MSYQGLSTGSLVLLKMISLLCFKKIELSPRNFVISRVNTWLPVCKCLSLTFVLGDLPSPLMDIVTL